MELIGMDVLPRESAAEIDDALRALDAFGGARDERDPDEIAARVRAVRIARQVRAGQNRHIIVGVQATGELGVRQAGARDVGPR